MNKKPKPEKNETSESWLLPYSDLMTLLLAVFIVLFAVSSIEKDKAEEIASAFSGIFMGGVGMLDGVTDILNDPEDMYIDNLTPTPTDQDYYTDTLTARINTLDQALRTYFDENQMYNDIEIQTTQEEIKITLDSDILFPPGHAELNSEEKIIAKHIAELIYNAQDMDFAFQVVVSGHTDTVPIGTGYASNWELSLHRAANFTLAMLTDSQLDPRLFSAVGHGELDPIATNDTPEGRAKNRRVELKIIKGGNNNAGL